MIADDHPIVCKGLAAIIHADPGMQLVAEVSNGAQAVQAFRDNRPDVVLIDLRMPVMSGVEAIKTIRQEFPFATFIILTTFKGDEDIYRGLEAGAKGYLLKGMPSHELLDAIRHVHRGGRYVPQPVLDTLASRPPNSNLTGREMEVLRLIVRGMSNKQIAENLGISESTVKWHVNIVLGRLNVSDRTGAAVTALRRGIVEL
jgi:two-component system NarL family response regulator